MGRSNVILSVVAGDGTPRRRAFSVWKRAPGAEVNITGCTAKDWREFWRNIERWLNDEFRAEEIFSEQILVVRSGCVERRIMLLEVEGSWRFFELENTHRTQIETGAETAQPNARDVRFEREATSWRERMTERLDALRSDADWMAKLGDT